MPASARQPSLRHLLRLPDAPLVTATGAGGKSSLLFRLAREFPTALLTTTTHLGAWQLPWADEVRYLKNPAALRTLEENPPSGVVLLLAAPPGTDRRARGLPAETLEALHTLRTRRGLPLLIEADGARQRPLKAPAAHEPCLPPLAVEKKTWLHLTLAGLSALGQPLDDAHVHRPQVFARLSGLAPGVPITAEALAAVMQHPLGGLKSLPAGPRRVAVLTQALTPQQQAAGQRLAEALQSSYHAVLLLESAPTSAEQPAVMRPLALWEPVAAVILAAGGGTRMGQPKALLPWRGQPFVRHVATAALQAGLKPLIVVSGAQPLQQALRGLDVHIVENTRWQEGQGLSVALGTSALPPECGAAVFLHVDQPHISPLFLRSLRQEHARTLAPIIAPLVDGRRTIPVLFDRCTFADLQQLHGVQGGRVLFSRYPLHYLPWLDRSLLWDVDTPQDYQRLLAWNA